MGRSARRARAAGLAARTTLAAALVATVWAAASGAHARRHAPRCHGHAHARRCGPSRPAPDAVSVHAHEYRLTLSRPAVRGGRVIVEFANEGQDPHNLQLAPITGPGETTGAARDAFPTLSSGKLATQALTLTAGTWRLWCSLPGHDAAGMHATLTVTAGGALRTAR